MSFYVCNRLVLKGCRYTSGENEGEDGTGLMHTRPYMCVRAHTPHKNTHQIHTLTHACMNARTHAHMHTRTLKPRTRVHMQNACALVRTNARTLARSQANTQTIGRASMGMQMYGNHTCRDFVPATRLIGFNFGELFFK